MTTAPPSVVVVPRPANRSPFFEANWRQAASWAAPSTLSPSSGSSARSGQVSDVCWTQKDTSGGSRETVVKLLATRPIGAPSRSPQIATTPVGKQE
jgi:hypothetical protein